MMFSKLIQAAAVAATASAGTMMPRQDDHGWNFAPTLEPFITMSLSVYWPANITTPWGLIGGSNTCLGGTVKGAFEAEILPYGTAFERVIVSESAGENSFYENKYIFMNAKNETFLFEVNGILNYADDTLHGFGYGRFTTMAEGWEHINYKPYAWEVQAQFNTGGGQVAVFEFKTGGGGCNGEDPTAPGCNSGENVKRAVEARQTVHDPCERCSFRG